MRREVRLLPSRRCVQATAFRWSKRRINQSFSEAKSRHRSDEFPCPYLILLSDLRAVEQLIAPGARPRPVATKAKAAPSGGRFPIGFYSIPQARICRASVAPAQKSNI